MGLLEKAGGKSAPEKRSSLRVKAEKADSAPATRSTEKAEPAYSKGSSLRDKALQALNSISSQRKKDSHEEKQTLREKARHILEKLHNRNRRKTAETEPGTRASEDSPPESRASAAESPPASEPSQRETDDSEEQRPAQQTGSGSEPPAEPAAENSLRDKAEKFVDQVSSAAAGIAADETEKSPAATGLREKAKRFLDAKRAYKRQKRDTADEDESAPALEDLLSDALKEQLGETLSDEQITKVLKAAVAALQTNNAEAFTDLFERIFDRFSDTLESLARSVAAAAGSGSSPAADYSEEGYGTGSSADGPSSAPAGAGASQPGPAGDDSPESDESGSTADKSAGESADDEDKDRRKRFPGGRLKLTHAAADIIPRNSPFGHQQRSLLNAERFAYDEEHQMAIDLYRRVADRVPVSSIKKKINRNIRDIEDFLDQQDEEQSKVHYMVMPAGGENMPQPAQNEMPGQAEAFQAAAGQTEASDAYEDDEPTPFDGGFSPEPTVQPESESEDSATGSQPAAESGSMPSKGTEDKGGPGESFEGLANQIAQAFFEIQKAVFKTGAMNVDAGHVETDEESDQSEMPASPSEEPEEEPPEAPSHESDEDTTPPPSQQPEEEQVEPSDPGVMEQSAVPPLGGGEGVEGEGGYDDEEPSDETKEEDDSPPVQEIKGVLELKPPDEEDTPFLTLTYDFSRIPHRFALSADHSILEYAYYKYKPMLVKAQKFIKRKQITKALNYYRVIREQEIPGEFRAMVDRNIEDITEYLQKYLMTRQD